MATFALAMALSIPVAGVRPAYCQGAPGAEPAGPIPGPSAELRWHYAGGDASSQEQLHRIEVLPDHRRIERLVVAAGVGTAVYYFHPLPPAAVIEESACMVELRSNRPGVQVFFSVVLPRTLDRRTGRPLALLVPGEILRLADGWSALQVSQVPLGLEREIRPLRLQLGGLPTDPRGAFINGIVLNIYGGPGETDIWLGSVQTQGMVPPTVVSREGIPSAPDSLNQPAESTPPAGAFSPRDPFETATDRGVVPAVGWSNTPFSQEAPPLTTIVRGTPGEDASPSSPSGRISLDGSLVRIDGQPFFVRAVEHRGEPLDYLQRLGFNAIWVEQAHETLLREAKDRGLWVIARPDPALFARAGAASQQRTLGPQFEPVLAWDFGEQNSTADVQAVQQSAEAWRRQTDHGGGLLLARPQTDLRAVSRAVDVLGFGREPVFSSLTFRGYAEWLRGRSLLARPGTPIWVTVQTQPDPALVEQWRVAGADTTGIETLEPDQLRILTYLSLTAGARGLIFRSRSPLDAADGGTRSRARAMELANRELALVEPFLSGGQFAGMVESTRPEVAAALFRTDRARLLIPLWLGRGAQLVPGQSVADEVTFVVPGVPEAYSAYLLLPGSAAPLDAQRITGGMRVRLTECGPASMVVLTQDPLVLQHLSERGRTMGSRMAELWGEMSQETLRQVRHVYEQTAKIGNTFPDAEAWFRMSSDSLQAGDAAMRRGDTTDAVRQYQRAMRPPALLRRLMWESAQDPDGDPTTDPLAVSFPTLPWYLAQRENWRTASWGENRLPGGEMENAQAWSSLGWQVYQYATPGAKARAQLLATAARSGNLGLCLSVLPSDPQQPILHVESPPIWCESPPVSVGAGDWIRVEGWVYISRPTSGSPDGLVIQDSIGGDALAVRIASTVGWRPFRLDRIATQTGQFRLRIMMTGLGEACLDDLSIRTRPADGPLAGRPIAGAATQMVSSGH